MSTRGAHVSTCTLILGLTLAGGCRDQPSPLDPTPPLDVSALPAPSYAETGDGAVFSDTVVTYGASGYHYLVGPPGHTPGFEDPSFDASSWSVGDAAFGRAGFNCELESTIRTPWPVGTDLLVRKSFELPQGATRIRIATAIDNDIQGIYLNGTPISDDFPSRSEDCAVRDRFVYEISVADLGLYPGPILLAVRAHDYGVVTYFDIEVAVSVEVPTECDCEHEKVTEGVPEASVNFTPVRDALEARLRGLATDDAVAVLRYQQQMNRYAGLDSVLVDGPIDNEYISFGTVWNEVEITTGVYFQSINRAIEEGRELSPSERLDIEGAYTNFAGFRSRVRRGYRELTRLEGLLNDQKRAKWFKDFEKNQRRARQNDCMDGGLIDDFDTFVDLFKRDSEKYFIDQWGGKIGQWTKKLVDIADWALWVLDSLDLLHPVCGPINRSIQADTPSFLVLLEAEAAIQSLRTRYEDWLDCLDRCHRTLVQAQDAYSRHERTLR